MIPNEMVFVLREQRLAKMTLRNMKPVQIILPMLQAQIVDVSIKTSRRCKMEMNSK